jgi:cell division protein WhiA
MTERTFSKIIKSDLLRVTNHTREEAEAEVITAFLAAGRPGDADDDLPAYFVTGSSGYAERLVGELRLIGLDALAEKTLRTGDRNSLRWYVYPLPLGELSFSDLLLSYETEEKLDSVSSNRTVCRAALRGAFLASGTMTDPLKAYGIEIALRNKAASDYITLLFHAENIAPSLIERNGRPVLYIKEGQAIADFLALIGAHSGLLKFESIRVDKELRNSVNRIVNCDTANARRQADTSAQQSEIMAALLQSDESTSIPQELFEAARVRVENPGLSIRDLGLLMNPPIGKSGMNHRLQKLMELARDAGLS